MTISYLTLERFRNQQLGGNVSTRAEEIVAWLGAVQAQDYAGAEWSIGLRLPGSNEGDIEKAVADRRIVLTWALRGTLHFVAAPDIRWMLALLAPGIIAKRASRYRQLGLDEKTFAECKQVLIRELQDGRQRTRKDLISSLEDAGISTEGQRGYHLLGRSGLEGVICFGPKEDRQQTFVLLDAWIPPSPGQDHLTSMAGLAGRYVASHGPATLQDFIWWSGLSAADARSALAAAGPDLYTDSTGGRVYWRSKSNFPSHHASPKTVFLPAYDEYLLGYRDRSHAIDPGDAGKVNLINGLALPIIIDGKVAGTWKRTPQQKKILIALDYFHHPKEDEQSGILAAAERYGEFIGKSVEVQHSYHL